MNSVRKWEMQFLGKRLKMSHGKNVTFIVHTRAKSTYDFHLFIRMSTYFVLLQGSTLTVNPGLRPVKIPKNGFGPVKTEFNWSYMVKIPKNGFGPVKTEFNWSYMVSKHLLGDILVN